MFDWLQYFADWLIYSVFGVSAQSHWGQALNFFVFDTLKIFLLLFFITTIMGIVNSYFPVEKVRNFLFDVGTDPKQGMPSTSSLVNPLETK